MVWMKMLKKGKIDRKSILPSDQEAYFHVIFGVCNGIGGGTSQTKAPTLGHFSTESA